CRSRACISGCWCCQAWLALPRKAVYQIVAIVTVYFVTIKAAVHGLQARDLPALPAEPGGRAGEPALRRAIPQPLPHDPAGMAGARPGPPLPPDDRDGDRRPFQQSRGAGLPARPGGGGKALAE